MKIINTMSSIFISLYLGAVSGSLVIIKNSPLQVRDNNTREFHQIHLSSEQFINLIRCVGVWDAQNNDNEIILQKRGIIR